MKRNTKLIAMISLIALVAAIFAVAAFADGGGAPAEPPVELPAGSYTAPLGSFNPADAKWAGAYDGIAYGVWANERAFISGLAPAGMSTSTELTIGNIGTSGYVHAFKDLTISNARFTTTKDLVLGLGGNRLTVSIGDGFQSGATPVTIKDGYLSTTTGNGLRPHHSNTVWTFDNVEWTVANGTTFYGSYAKEINFIDSKLIFTNNARFYIGNSSAARSISFENTDIVIESNITKLFDVYSGSNYAINFDSDSSIWLKSGTVANWFALDAASYVTVNFEPGFTLLGELTKPSSSGQITVTENAATVVEDSNVGKYTAPAGAWNPLSAENAGNYPGISFATWESEEDFLAGEAPLAWYQDLVAAESNYTTTFTADNIGAPGVGYVHCFEDVANTISGRLSLPSNRRIVVNLGGKTLKDIGAWIIGSGNQPNTLLMFKNGTYLRPSTASGITYCRQDGSLVFQNILYDASEFANALFEDIGLELMVFEDSTLLLNEKNEFRLRGNGTAPYQTYIIFKNTDVVQSGSNPVPLFKIYEGAYTENATIIFDKDSSLTRSNNKLIYLENTKNFTYVQGLYFEAGCEVSPSAMPTYDLEYSYNGNTATANSSGKFLEIAVIAPTAGGIQYTLPTATAIPTVSGTNAPVGRPLGAFDASAFTDKVKAEIYASKTGWKLDDIDNSALKKITIVPVWKPDGTTSYAVWATETDYASGANPVVVGSTAKLLTEDIATLGDGVTYGTAWAEKTPGYVVLFTDVEIDSAPIYIGNAQVLIIDLNGCTITSKAGFTVGDPAAAQSSSLTLIGGTLVLADGGFTTARGTDTLFERMTLSATKNAQDALLSASAGDVVYKECTITLEGAYSGFDLIGGTVLFKTTSITQAHTSAAPLFWVGSTTDSLTSYYVTVRFDNMSTLLRGSNALAGVLSSERAGIELKVYLDDGMSVAPSSVPSFTYLSSMSPISSGEQLSVTAPDSLCDIAIVTDDLSDKYTEPYFVANGNLTKLIGNIANYAAAEIDPSNPRNFFQVWETTLTTGNAATPFSMRDGAIIKLFRDTELGLGSTYMAYDLTIDLNGHKLTHSAGTIQLGYSRSGTWEPARDIRFISSEGRGILDFSGHSGTPLQARPGTHTYFENLDIIVRASIFNDNGSELIYFKNCKISGISGGQQIVSCSGIGAGSENHDRYMVFDGSTTEKISFVNFHCNVADYTGCHYVIMNGSTMDNSVPLVKIMDKVYPEGAQPPSETVVRNIYFDMTTKFTVASSSFASIGTELAQYHHKVEFSFYEGITDYTNVGTPVDFNKVLFMKDGDYFTPANEATADLSALSYSYAAPGGLKVAALISLDLDDKPMITFSDIKTLADGTLVTLYRDLVFYADDSTGAHAAGLIFELGGHTLTLKDSFTVHGDLTIKNGTVVAPELLGTLFVMNSDCVFTLTDVDFGNMPEIDCIFDAGNGDIIFTDGTVTAEAAALARLTADGSLTLTRITASLKTLATVSYDIGTTVEITVDDSTVSASEALIALISDGAVYDGAAGEYVNVRLEDAKLTAPVLVADTAAATSPLIHFTLSEVFFSAEPVADEAVADISVVRGERLMQVADSSGYTWRVTVFDVNLKASIFIESDFGIKFYIPEGTNITKLTIAGIEYVIADITDTEIYDGNNYKFILITNILPTDAAEVIDMTVVFDKDGIAHTEDTGYSVIDYFKTLLNSDKTVKLKQLGTAALDYISAAYALAGKDNADLAALLASDQYIFYRGETLTAVGGEDNTSALSGVISGAQLELSAIVKIKFNLVAGYTGTLTINGREFAIADGMYDGKAYISLSLPAYELTEELNLSADGAVGTYSLEKYAAAIASGETEATSDEEALVAAFYNYCRYAKAYRAIYGS